MTKTNKTDGPKHDGDLCDSEKNNCFEGFVCKDDGNMNGVGRCIPGLKKFEFALHLLLIA